MNGERLNKLENDVKKINDILFNIGDDTRFKAKVRKQVVEMNAARTLPVIIDDKGNRWQVNSVTKLN